MPITVTWENDEKTALCICYKHPWTLEEYDAGQQETQRLLASVPHTAHLIMDVREGDPLPSNAIGRFRQSFKSRLPNQGKLVFVGTNMLVKTVVEVVQKTTRATTKGQEVLFTNTREEALMRLKTTT